MMAVGSSTILFILSCFVRVCVRFARSVCAFVEVEYLVGGTVVVAERGSWNVHTPVDGNVDKTLDGGKRYVCFVL